ncbi:hypothetical protein LTR56_004207 [Elasticomyces elasticus]|nr:hypothetical protein LTR56_004207 [Elasticomyces elasticus]KAK3655096.1 hypothetical protein LTR22_010406 [Elasticomyces elasticus]KAK4910891.1 hypothetical protein LTR49_020503 [Elasticomyces elasticus]KAK5750310.1 hypothetical protein LTS12_019649 [Elasticomyces elasticus]
MAKRLHTEIDDDYPKGYKRRAKKCNNTTKQHGVSDVPSMLPNFRNVADLGYKPVDRPVEIGRGLFSLPVELRLSIYEYVLPLDEFTYISDNELNSVPALLLVSRQIRQETCNLWYMGNKFIITSYDCESNFARPGHDTSATSTFSTLMSRFEILGDPNWNNLMTWCKAAFNDDTLVVKLPRREDLQCDADFAMHTTLAVALRTALRCQRNSLAWPECEAMLTDWRDAVGAYDKRWLA